MTHPEERPERMKPEHPCPVCGEELIYQGTLAYDKRTRTIVHSHCRGSTVAENDDVSGGKVS